jgi:hypothetical protein
MYAWLDKSKFSSYELSICEIVYNEADCVTTAMNKLIFSEVFRKMNFELLNIFNQLVDSFLL